mgnify:CR=1 FL=1
MHESTIARNGSKKEVQRMHTEVSHRVSDLAMRLSLTMVYS